MSGAVSGNMRFLYNNAIWLSLTIYTIAYFIVPYARGSLLVSLVYILLCLIGNILFVVSLQLPFQRSMINMIVFDVFLFVSFTTSIILYYMCGSN